MSKSSGVEKAKAEKVERKTVNAVVSHEFKEAFDSWADSKGWTTATALRYELQKAVGLNPDPPSSESDNDRYILSTAVEIPVQNAMKRIEDGKYKDNVANLIREIAANACGYDLTQEPERVRGSGAALLKERERVQSQSSVLLGLRKYMTPEQFISTISDAGKTIEDIGLTADDVTEEAFAALR